MQKMRTFAIVKFCGGNSGSEGVEEIAGVMVFLLDPLFLLSGSRGTEPLDFKDIR